jgi:dipeptidyl aminopeptidase/acylaminoacyl peptidase
MRSGRARLVALTIAAALILAACSGDQQEVTSTSSSTASPAAPGTASSESRDVGASGAPGAGGLPSGTPSSAPSGTPSGEATLAAAGPPPTGGPVRLERWFDRDLSGGSLRLGAERERTAAYRSYDVSYRSQDLRISGVINVPTGRGPFPAVVLAHGYIDPAIYVRGQGMPRERRLLAAAGYIALHVDYRNHAESDDDPALVRTARLGYSVDVLNAVHALRATDAVPVDDDRIALVGRSMGGGVVLKALEMAPGLVAAGVVFASVSSDEADNYDQFSGPSPYWDYVRDRWGSPERNPDFWEGISADQHFDRVTEPVLIHHGAVDGTCPPRWARHTARAMKDAGVDVALRWYEGEGHTFGDAALTRAMRRTVSFLDRQLT